MQKTLSVIIPAYNDEDRISGTLEAVDRYLKKQNYGYEIIVVSDGSKDNTAGVVEKIIPKTANLRLIANKENRGKGYVVRQGLLQAAGEIRLFTDSDNSTPIEQVEKMFPFFSQGYDIVIGSRDVKGAKLDPPQPALRRFLGEGFGFLANIITGTWGIADTQCGFKAMTVKAVEDIIPRCKIDRFAFDPEILVIAKTLKYKIKEMPVLWKNDLRSTVKFSSMVKMFRDLFQIRINLISGVYGKKSSKK
jgi:dolichyl-phosphate beta-glucosyltransferase